MAKTENALEYLEELPKSLIIILSFVLLAAIAVADYLTGRVNLSVFYLIPVIMITWLWGNIGGILMSILATTVSFIINLAIVGYFEPPTTYWDKAVMLVTSLVIVYIISAFKNEKTLARRDALTGISNRKHFYELAKAEMKRSHSLGYPLTLAYIDLDNFRGINHLFGNSVGDEVLSLISGVIKSVTRSQDTVARLGGDEFAIMLPGMEPAKQVISKVLKNLSDIKGINGRNGLVITCSIGAVTYLEPPESLDKMLTQATALMYYVKENGKNNVKYEFINSRVNP